MDQVPRDEVVATVDAIMRRWVKDVPVLLSPDDLNELRKRMYAFIEAASNVASWRDAYQFNVVGYRPDAKIDDTAP